LPVKGEAGDVPNATILLNFVGNGTGSAYFVVNTTKIAQ
jgi:hypothetical protein